MEHEIRPIHKKIIDDRTWHLVIISGKNMNGLPFFSMVAVKDEIMKKLSQAQPPLNAADHGVVLAQGFAACPPPLLQREVMDRFAEGNW